MQNTSEQRHTDTHVRDVGTEIRIEPGNRKQSFLLFMAAGFVVITAIVFAGLYIDDVTSVILNKPTVEHSAPSVPTTSSLDSLAATMTVADDKALEVREGLTVWLKADAFAASGTGDSVQILPDASGMSNHALQAAAEAQPTFVANAINGKPVLRFDGQNDHFFLGNLGDSTAATIIAVWAKPTACGGMYQRIYSSSGSNIDYLSKGAALIPPTENNGTGAAPPQINVLTDKVMDLRNFYIGRLNASPEQFYCGDLAELLVYKRQLGPAEQQSVTAYLKTKYGL